MRANPIKPTAIACIRIMKKSKRIMRYLLKADVGSPLTKALAANVEAVLADDTVSVLANAAVQKVRKA